MKYILTMISLSMFIMSSAHSTRHGHHGMALFSDGQSLFASHLPLYKSPHDYQLVYHVETDHKKQLIKHLEKDMLTILPQHFNLNTLIEGKSLTINTTIYEGHFERGGQKLFEDDGFTFHKQIFKRQISDLNANTLTERFFLIEMDNSHKQLAIHAIGPRPSFDMIALITNKNCPVKKHKNNKELQLKMKNKDHLNEADNLLDQCGQNDILYFETQDFKAINNKEHRHE